MRPLSFASEGEPTPPRFPDGYLESLTVRQLDALAIVLKSLNLEATRSANLVAVAEEIKRLTPSELATLTFRQIDQPDPYYGQHQQVEDPAPWDRDGRVYEISILNPHLTYEQCEARAKREYDEAVLIESDTCIGRWDWNEDQLCDEDEDDEEE